MNWFLKSFCRISSLTVGSLLAAMAIWADAPLPVPSSKTICSSNGRYCARLDVDANTIRIFEKTPRGDRDRWAMRGWFGVADLSNDGDHLVGGYDGGNLVPLTHPKKTVILNFFERGKIIRAVRLEDFLKPSEKLERTVSHYVWGDYLGFDSRGLYDIKLISGRLITFNPTTGQIVRD